MNTKSTKNTMSVNVNGKRYIVKRLRATDEYVVRVLDSTGRRIADYYTTDLDDALHTRDAMVAEDSNAGGEQETH